MKKALITGITGQDGAYLARFLLHKGYEVHGIKRRASLINTSRIDDIYEGPPQDAQMFHLHYGDLTDSLNITRIIKDVAPDEIYNLGAMSHVKVSFEMPEYTANVDALGTLRILEAVRFLDMVEKVRIYQASSSELYGLVQEVPQRETTPFYPRSPYAVAKLYSYWICRNYREAYKFFVSNGILFNHESPMRGETFVTRKITRAVVDIALGKSTSFQLGNLDAKRDWGHAADYVEAMWKILQHPTPDDFVIATGVSETVRNFVKMAFQFVGVELEFSGSGLSEQARVVNCTNPKYQLPQGQIVLNVNENYFRPSEVDELLGDASKARKLLDWQPKHDLQSLVADMMHEDINSVIN